MKIILVLAIGLVLLATTSSAQIYKWVDKDGGVHFSNVPTSGIEKKETVFPEDKDNRPVEECRYPKPIGISYGDSGGRAKSYDARELEEYHKCVERNKK
jgi:hypothetical protein